MQSEVPVLQWVPAVAQQRLRLSSTSPDSLWEAAAALHPAAAPLHPAAAPSSSPKPVHVTLMLWAGADTPRASLDWDPSHDSSWVKSRQLAQTWPTMLQCWLQGCSSPGTALPAASTWARHRASCTGGCCSHCSVAWAESKAKLAQRECLQWEFVLNNSHPPVLTNCLDVFTGNNHVIPLARFAALHFLMFRIKFEKNTRIPSFHLCS